MTVQTRKREEIASRKIFVLSSLALSFFPPSSPPPPHTHIERLDDHQKRILSCVVCPSCFIPCQFKRTSPLIYFSNVWRIPYSRWRAAVCPTFPSFPPPEKLIEPADKAIFEKEEEKKTKKKKRRRGRRKKLRRSGRRKKIPKKIPKLQHRIGGDLFFLLRVWGLAEEKEELQI